MNTQTVLNLNTHILDLYICSNISNSNSRNNYESLTSNCMDVSSLFNIFKLLYHGTGKKTKERLSNKTNLKKIIEAMPESEHTYTRSGVFIQASNTFNNTYHRMFNRNSLLHYIPTDEKKRKIANNLIVNKFQNWPVEEEPFFKHPISSNPRLLIRDQSYFKGKWETPFDRKKTIVEDFYIGNDKKIKIPMMTSHDENKEPILTYFDIESKMLFASLPYTNGYSMLVIKPEQPHTKEQLFNLLVEKQITANSISDFYNLKGKLTWFTEKKLPKFEFESSFELNNNTNFNQKAFDSCSYLKIIFDKSIDLSNIDNNPNNIADCIVINSETKIINNEDGTFVKSQSDFYGFDNCQKIDPKCLKIDSNFIFMIVDENKVISKVALYVGEQQ